MSLAGSVDDISKFVLSGEEDTWGDGKKQKHFDTSG